MNKAPIAVLISGRGSNMQALAQACGDSTFPAYICCVISDKKEALGLLSAQKLHIPCFAFERKDFASKAEHEAALLKKLAEYQPQLICLAGFMRRLSADFIKHYPRRVVNIHPSLLPAFKGLNAQQQALEAGATVTGCTVHVVNEELDDGEVLSQAAVNILKDDTAESLSQRILQAEHKLYPETVKAYLEKINRQQEMLKKNAGR